MKIVLILFVIKGIYFTLTLAQQRGSSGTVRIMRSDKTQAR